MLGEPTACFTLRLHEHAFEDFDGVPEIVRHDNLKAAVVRACLYDPDANPTYLAFAEHWGFTPLPTKPRNPQENGKQERSGGYVKSNALKGRRFDSLQEFNEHLRRWNRTIARLRIHGTTRKQSLDAFSRDRQSRTQARGATALRDVRQRNPERFIRNTHGFFHWPVRESNVGTPRKKSTWASSPGAE